MVAMLGHQTCKAASRLPTLHCRVGTWMDDCLWVGNHLGMQLVSQVNSAFHPLRVGQKGKGTA